MRSLRLKLRALFNRRKLDRDLQDEIAYHLEQRQAHGEARAAFGNVTLIQESTRDLWMFSWLEDLSRDVRHALRTMRHAPGHTLAIVLLLAVGIGANAAIFSLTYPILIDRLPVPEPNRLISFDGINTQRGRPGGWGWSGPTFEAFQRRYASADVAAAGAIPPGAGTDRRFDGLETKLVTGNFFHVLGLGAASGRLLVPEDDTYDDPRAVFVLSDASWKGRLGGDPSVIGREFQLYGRTFTLVGVTPGDFRGMGADIWIPYNWQPVVGDRDVRRDRGRSWLDLMGRLKPGVSLAQAQAEADIAWSQVRTEFRLPPEFSLRLQRGDRGFEGLRNRFATPLWILTGAVAMLLVIACANVASLLLARSGARQKEIAVRQAIGCGRARLIRQFLVESLVLACCGGLLGLVLAAVGARTLVAMAAPEAIEAVDPGLNGGVLWFTLAVSVGSAVLFGLIPAWRASKVSIEPVLKSAARGASASRSRQLLNRSCVVVQTAFSAVLVLGAALFGQSLYRLYSFDAGFEREQVITATVNARALGFRSNPDPQYAAAADRLVERLSVLPGVESVSVTGTGFLTGSSRTTGIVVQGRETESPRSPVRVNQATSNFLETLGVSIIMGRGFSPRDTTGAPLVAVVNQSFTRAHFPNETPIGKRLNAGYATPVEIVGVARDSKYNDFREESVPLVYLPLHQDPRNFNHVQLKVHGSAEALVPLVRAAILEVDPRFAPTRVETLEASLDRVLARDILLARLSGLFGALALLVACFGVYGMISYVVASRTAEIGVRLAIGAQPRGVLGHVIGDALKTVGPGLALGLAGALAVERVITSLLFGATGRDLATYAAVAGCLLLTSVVAAYVPARRASRIDPVIALRCE
jgi:predicted permease